jgi:hypothetical protein
VVFITYMYVKGDCVESRCRLIKGTKPRRSLELSPLALCVCVCVCIDNIYIYIYMYIYIYIYMYIYIYIYIRGGVCCPPVIDYCDCSPADVC